MPPSPLRTRTNDPQATRRRVLDAAAELFQTRGYHATAMHEIARAAGVTGGAMHHHFATKKALGLAVIEERVAIEVRDTWMAPVVRADSAAEGVAEVCAAIAAALDAKGGVNGCPLNNLTLELSLSDPDFQAAVARVFRGWRAALQHAFEAEGRSPGASAALATFVVAAYSGAMAMAKAEQSTAPLKVCAGALEGLLG
jgi:AcrR family transcriptional regulator